MTNKQNLETEKNVHIPVLLKEVESFVFREKATNIDKKPETANSIVIFDGTFGGGGYTQSFLEKGGTVFASDLDLEAVEKGEKEFSKEIENEKLSLEVGNFGEILGKFKDEFFDAMVVDLGFSSNQMEVGGRGFSYQKTEEEFDLRYNTEKGKKAWEKIVNTRTTDELKKIIFKYSGETFSPKIADSLFENIRTKYRSLKNSEQETYFFTVGEVVEAIISAIPDKFKNKQNAILSRVWQALRIWTNNEFTSLQKFLDKSVEKIKPGGVIIVVSFHSLEDKMVTQFFRQLAKPLEVDEFGNKQINWKLLTKKAITPSEEEIEKNVRSRSGLMRVLQRIK